MGIIIPAATSLESPEAKNQVEWEKESTKDKTGAAYSGKNTFKSGEGEFTVLHQGDSFSKAHSYLLLTDVPGASANSGATITSKDSNGNQAFIATETRGTTEQEVAVGAGSELKTLLTQAGASEFLQLVASAKRKVNFGSTTVEFPGENIRSNATEVSHGLGTTPLAVLATGDDDGRGVGVTSKTSTKITVRAQTLQGDKPVAGSKVTVYWLAIG